MASDVRSSDGAVHLLHCPFCGGPAKLSRHPKGYDLAHCADDTCDPGRVTLATPENWNRRAELPMSMRLR
jgi:hypothetical protein